MFLFNQIKDPSTVVNIVMSNYSLNSEVMEGVLLKMKKGMAGGMKWKKHWVVADKKQLMQWTSATQPKSLDDQPKYTIDLRRSEVEESTVRKFAFSITNASQEQSFVYAAETFDAYEKWLRILFSDGSETKSDIPDSIDPIIANAKKSASSAGRPGVAYPEDDDDDDDSVIMVNHRPLKYDVISAFFFEKDITMVLSYFAKSRFILKIYNLLWIICLESSQPRNQ